MQTQTTYKELSIANHNNKLAGEYFIVIDFAPAPERIPKRSQVEQKLYSAKHNDETIFVKIIDLLPVQFKQLTDHITLWANAKTYIEFKQEWFAQHPHCTEETPMMVYYYKKVQISETINLH
jgi:hypothetical protein